ncbi:hypothetical protein [Gordonia aichiensis]|uniref:hypothetical protein n=1 Tax=Gordonia aichiensis TaxID=36820 RepID=UPI00326588A8
MALTEPDVTFMRGVADQIDGTVVTRCTGGRWMSGQGLSQDTASTMRAVQADGTEYHLGTAIDKNNQRAMMAAQPAVLTQIAETLRSADEGTPAPLAAALLHLAQLYNTTMALRVPEPAATV